MCGGDFLQILGPDVSTNIVAFLDDPADIVRATAVSRTWRQFVVENGFCKRLCLRLFPEVSSAVHAIEVDNIIEPVRIGSNDARGLENLEKHHRVYAILARGLSPILRKDCIMKAISASSTDNYPDESVQNTLEPRDRIGQKGSYWSSEGESDSQVPEKLTYKIISDLCFITEINIQPFQAYFQYGFPIYSAKAVRFRMGHLKSPLPVEFMDAVRTDDFVWTYVSPEFPMAQANCLQNFKLPEPVLCIGAILQIELLGRVQRQEMDGLYYICISHVQVVGRTLLPSFDADFVYHPKKCVVKYEPEGEKCTSSKRASDDEASASSQLNTLDLERLMRRAGRWERVILNTLLGNAVVDGENESDEEPAAA